MKATGSEAGDVSRRDFLRFGGLGVVGLKLAEQLAEAREWAGQRNCILVLMTGGPGHLDTFDPKPDAPTDIRGPFRAIQTTIPGVHFSETLPRLATRTDRFTVLRSLYHNAAPIHETGLQLIQTGRLAHQGILYPAFGSVVGATLGARSGVPPFVLLPRAVSGTGVKSYTGQTEGFLKPCHAPLELDPEVAPAGQTTDGARALRTRLAAKNEPASLRLSYGEHRFGRLCLAARQLVELGVRTVTVNLFDRLHGQVTWDCHGRGPSSPGTLNDYRDSLCPRFDQAFSALLDDLRNRGLLDNTVVIAVGEFGRTPRVNEWGGRDHWSGVWSALMAGGGIAGNRVLGASDRTGAEPLEMPVTPAEVTATVYRVLGLETSSTFLNSDEEPLPLLDAAPIEELMA